MIVIVWGTIISVGILSHLVGEQCGVGLEIMMMIGGFVTSGYVMDVIEV